MAPWAACLRERRRTYEGCRDLHQTRSVLAAVSGGGRGYASASRLLSGRCKKTFEFASKRPKTGKNLAGITHPKHPILHRKISLCVATWRAPGMESRTEQVNIELAGIRSA